MPFFLSQITFFVFVPPQTLPHICNVIGKKRSHQQSKMIESNLCDFKI